MATTTTENEAGDGSEECERGARRKKTKKKRFLFAGCPDDFIFNDNVESRSTSVCARTRVTFSAQQPSHSTICVRVCERESVCVRV